MCRFITGTDIKLDCHLLTLRHIDKKKPEKNNSVRQENINIFTEHFTLLTRSASAKVWVDRKAKLQSLSGNSKAISPEKIKLIEDLTRKKLAGELDTLEAAMMASRVSSPTAKVEEEKSPYASYDGTLEDGKTVEIIIETTETIKEGKEEQSKDEESIIMKKVGMKMKQVPALTCQIVNQKKAHTCHQVAKRSLHLGKNIRKREKIARESMKEK